MALIGFQPLPLEINFMNELEKINNIVSISSLDIAKLTGKEHKKCFSRYKKYTRRAGISTS